MSRKHCIYRVYIADGFADDCDELIHRCMQVNTLSYEKFCDVWRDMKFASIFHGRCSSAELAELSEETLHIAKHYMVANTSNFEESVAGLFLVYALLNLQPLKSFAALRLIDDDVPAIKHIEAVARRARRYDVLYILGKVLIEGPTQYHVAARERGLEHALRKYLEGYTTLDKQGIRPKGVFFRQNEELDILRELNRLGKLYKEAKHDICGRNKTDRSLFYVDDIMPAELESSLKNVISGMINDEGGDGVDGVGNGESSPRIKSAEPISVQSIKERAMKTAVQPIKHLTGIQERGTTSPKKPAKTQPKTPPKKNVPSPKRNTQVMTDTSSPKGIASSAATDMPSLTQKSPSARKKTNSPKQNPLSRNSPKQNPLSRNSPPLKRRGLNYDPRPKKIKKRKIQKVIFSSSDEDDDLLVLESDTSDGNDANDSDKPVCVVDNVEEPQKKLNIQIDSMPIVIRSEEEGVYYEIEIVDNYDENASSPKIIRAMVEQESNPAFNIPNNLNIFNNFSIIQMGNPSTSVSVDTETNDAAKMAKVNVKQTSRQRLKAAPLKKREKREMKKTKVKTKFKRMGLLPLANFGEEDSNSKT